MHDIMSGKTITLFGIPNCDQVKKARIWLDTHAISHTFHDFKKSGIRADWIKIWLKDVAWDVLVNRKGTTWRALTPEQKAAICDVQSAVELMVSAPSIIKRPVVCVTDKNGGSNCYAGFSDALFQQIFHA